MGKKTVRELERELERRREEEKEEKKNKELELNYQKFIGRNKDEMVGYAHCDIGRHNDSYGRTTSYTI